MQALRRAGSVFAAVFSFLLFVFVPVGLAGAEEIKLLHATALHAALKDVVPRFEKASGHKVVVQYATAGLITGRIQKDEPADVGIVTTAQAENLRKQGKLVGDSLVVVGKVATGVYVPKGAPKPDITSVDAFKRALLNARAVAHADPAGGGASGIYAAGLIQRLGLAEQLKPKIRLYPGAAVIFPAVARGEADIAIGQVSEILDFPDVDLVGPLPTEIQNYTEFTAGIVASSKRVDAAKALIAFIRTPESRALMKTRGFE